MSSPILYLSEKQVDALMPDPLDAVRLVGQALRAIGAGQVSLAHHVVHPRPTTGLSAIVGVIGGATDLAGQKWVSEAPAAEGVSALLMMNDPESGTLHTLMGARGLTGLRTAAVSGACVQALGRAGPVALIGTGLQCRTHLTVLDALGFRDVRIAFRRHSSAMAVLDWAATHVPRVALTLVDSIESAVGDATVVLTMVTRGATDCRVDPAWLRSDALLLPVDFAHCIDAAAAGRAVVLASDHPPTFEEVRQHGGLPGYPSNPLATGTVLDLPRADGLILIQNLGNAACDLVIAEHVRRAALKGSVGQWLPR